MGSYELHYQIGLTLLEGIGDVLAKNLVAYCGSADQVFKTNKAQLEKIPGIGTVLAKAIVKNTEVLHRAAKEVQFINDHNIQPLFFTNQHYPKRLKHCHDAPVLLYYKGNADLNAQKIVSVVGTRTPSAYGKQMTEQLIAELTGLGCLVVSGLAYGVDILAHKEALEGGLKTVGVLAHGLDRIYPAVHTHYARKMVSQGGILTDFISGTQPDRENFPKRNRIVAGMCDALVVVESKKEGGSLITATIANSYNKDVFAFPGKSGDALSEGCNALIKTNKACLIESAADLQYVMNWQETSPKKSSQQLPLLLNLGAEEQAILNVFNDKQQLHVDEICQAVNLPVSKTASHLLQLEFSNAIKSLPGNRYQLNC